MLLTDWCSWVNWKCFIWLFLAVIASLDICKLNQVSILISKRIAREALGLRTEHFENLWSTPVVYGYRNFAILIQSEIFSWTPYPKIKNCELRYPNPKPLTQLYISLHIQLCLFCLTSQNLWLFCLLSDAIRWSGYAARTIHEKTTARVLDLS